MSELEGNCLVCQSGEPTAVVNASLAGVIEEALNHECIEEIFGGLNGVAGVMNEDFVDLAAESQQTIRLLKQTPGSVLGTSRSSLKKDEDLERALEVFETHNIRYFFFIGDGESMALLDQLDAKAKARGQELRVIAIPKTVNNDVSGTDHTPGYGSAIKRVATTVLELSRDSESIGQGDYVSIMEVQGRNTGWIAAGASLAKRRDRPHDPPHIILLPEVAFDSEKFLADVQKVLSRERFCIVVTGEGLVDYNGNYVALGSTSTDAFGHVRLGGTGEFLRSLVEERLGVGARSCKLGNTSRSAIHGGSEADLHEAHLAGCAAVLQAVENGKSGKMITLQRAESDAYKCETGWMDLSEVSQVAKQLPAEWINEDGISMNFPFVKYATPLIQGEASLTWENGLPVFAKLKGVRIDKLLPAYEY